MKLAIMQPYFFPYIGYFQLLSAVDAFVIYDDVNFIKGGWINRNYILSQGGKAWLSMPLRNASPNRHINEIQIGDRNHKLLATVRQNYSRAPQFSAVFPLIEDVLAQKEKNLAVFLHYGLQQVCDFLGIFPEWHISSSLNKDCALKGQDRVLAICQQLGAKTYINLPGGKQLYDRDSFSALDIKLQFLKPDAVPYPQLGDVFVANLSIIDILMFNTKEECRRILSTYELGD